MEFKKFVVEERPWQIESGLKRMQYLINNLAWENTIWQAQVGNEWAVSKSSQGHRLIALWPSEQSARLSMISTDQVKFKSLGKSSIEEELLSKMYEDEFIAAFPNTTQKYEILTVPEFRRALRFAQLLKLGYEGNLSKAETHELGQYVTLE